MPLALLLLTLTTASPLRPELYEARAPVPAGVLAPTLGSRGRDIYGGVRNVVSGSILTALGTGFGVLGAYGLIAAGNEPPGSTKTVYTALGWTSVGFGIVLGAVGIPLLVVGIVRLSSPGLASRLTVSEQGQLLVRF